jgi:hypothetical protein
LLSILYLCTKLKVPPRATAVRVRRAAQSPVAVEDAPPSRPTRPRPVHLCVTLCHGSMGTLLGLTLLTGMRLGWGLPGTGWTGAWPVGSGATSPCASRLDAPPLSCCPLPWSMCAGRGPLGRCGRFVKRSCIGCIARLAAWACVLPCLSLVAAMPGIRSPPRCQRSACL